MFIICIKTNTDKPNTMASETQPQSSKLLNYPCPILNKVQVFFPKQDDFSFARITYYSQTINNGKSVWTINKTFGYHFIDNIEDIASLDPQKDNYLKGFLRHPSFFMGYYSYWRVFYVGSLIDVSSYIDRKPFNVEFEFIYNDIRTISVLMPHTYHTIQTSNFKVGGESSLAYMLRDMGVNYEPIEPHFQPEPVDKIVCNFFPIQQTPQPTPIQEIQSNFEKIQEIQSNFEEIQ